MDKIVKVFVVSFLLFYMKSPINSTRFCLKRSQIVRAEQMDKYGRKCWDNVKIHLCGGQCDSNEISDWEFPFKKSHHPVCTHNARHSLVVRLRHCDDEVASGTEMFHFVDAEDCHCKICHSQKTSCEWLPPNSTVLHILRNN